MFGHICAHSTSTSHQLPPLQMKAVQFPGLGALDASEGSMYAESHHQKTQREKR